MVLALGLSGCGARTLLDDHAGDDAGETVRDAGPPVRDAGPGPDAGAPREDAGPAGRPCARDAECAGAQVCRAPSRFTPTDLAPHPLECGAPSPGEPAGAACDGPGDCDRGLCSLPGVCLRPCARDADCEASERCREAWVRTGPRQMQPFDACTALIAAPEAVRISGPTPSISPNPTMATSEDFPVFDPDALVVWIGDDGSIPFFSRVVTRGAPTVVFDSTISDPTDPAPLWGIGAATVGTDVLTILYPNGANTPRPPMGFRVEIGAFQRTDLERVVAQRLEGGTVFDVDLYLVGGRDLTSPDGSVPRPIARGIDDARMVLRPIGLSIGEVRVHEVVGQLRQRLGVLEGRSMGPIGTPPELPELYRLGAGANRPSVHIFFARMIEGALGIASGIPGPHVTPGTGASGVALAGDVIPARELGDVIAHEVGHYMGLFHTSEIDGDVGEPHPDTPECRQDRDADGDGILAPSECMGSGAENLMFWTGEGRQISPQQAEIMRRAYFVR